MNTLKNMDKVDLTIIKALQESGRTKRKVIAEKTGLSLPAISERLKKLEDEGIIKEYNAVIDPRKLGFDVTAFVVVTIDSSRHFKSFLDHVNKTEQIIECHAITGEGTHLIKVRAQDTQALEKLLSKIQSWQGVERTISRVVLSSPKETTNVPINF